ncbi:unnamed protein product, partial [Hapterophycus canaliculatus]
MDEVAGGKEVTFCVWNQGAFPCRFLFSAHKHFKFSPSVGHLPVGGRREIRATFHPTEPVKYDNEPVEFVTQKIRYPEPAPADDDGGDDASREGGQRQEEEHERHERRNALRVDREWDDSKTQLRQATEEDMRKGKEPPPPDMPAAPTLKRGPLTENGVQMVYAVQPEPRFE